MVVFEGQAFDEKKVSTISYVENDYWDYKGVEDKYELILTLTDDHTLVWPRLRLETVFSNINQIAQLINNRENEILKLRYKAD